MFKEEKVLMGKNEEKGGKNDYKESNSAGMTKSGIKCAYV